MGSSRTRYIGVHRRAAATLIDRFCWPSGVEPAPDVGQMFRLEPGTYGDDRPRTRGCSATSRPAAPRQHLAFPPRLTSRFSRFVKWVLNPVWTLRDEQSGSPNGEPHRERQRPNLVHCHAPTHQKLAGGQGPRSLRSPFGDFKLEAGLGESVRDHNFLWPRDTTIFRSMIAPPVETRVTVIDLFKGPPLRRIAHIDEPRI